MKKVAGKTRASLEEIRKLKGRSNVAALHRQQSEEKVKPSPQKQ
ncbi:hypothetical protein QQM79_20990 [Marinobacteraceae bacterium S3BR75-40.1]